MEIIETTRVSARQLQEIKQLICASGVYAMAPPKIYWDLIVNVRAAPGNYLCYSGNQLVGFLSAFLFYEDQYEISTFIHPQFRLRGLFSDMFELLRESAYDDNIFKFIFSCDARSASGLQCLKHLGAEYAFSEYQLIAHAPELPLADFLGEHDLRLVRVTHRQLDDVVMLDVTSFGSDWHEMLERYQQALIEEGRQIFLVYEGDKAVGKIHARDQDFQVILHDICVLPSFRGKGYGIQMMHKVLEQLTATGSKNFAVDVEVRNEAAIQLYEKLGFQVVRQFEYWEM